MSQDEDAGQFQYKYVYPKNFVENMDIQMVDFNIPGFEMKNIYAKPLPYNYKIEMSVERETNFMKDHKDYQQLLEEYYLTPKDKDCLDKIDVSKNKVVTPLVKTMIYNARVDRRDYEIIFQSIDDEIRRLVTEEEREREWSTLREIFQLIEEEKREQKY